MENYQRKSSRIARRAVYQGARPPSIDQGRIEKSASGSKSSQVIVGTPLLEETTSHRGGASKPRLSNTESKRCKWSEDDYIAVMRAYYEAKHHPKGNSCTKEAYSIWRNENENTRPSIDANKLANVRRDILKNKRLSENQLNVIEQEILLSSEKNIAQGLESTNRNADIVEINDIEE